jgi:hypothetical protein
MARPEEGKGWAKAVPDEQDVAVMEVTSIGPLCRGAAPVKGSGGIEAREGLKSPWNLTLRACQRIWTDA